MGSKMETLCLWIWKTTPKPNSIVYVKIHHVHNMPKPNQSKSTMSIIRQNKIQNPSRTLCVDSINVSRLSYHLKIWEYTVIYPGRLEMIQDFWWKHFSRGLFCILERLAFLFCKKCILRRICFWSSFFGSYILGSSATEDLSSAHMDGQHL